MSISRDGRNWQYTFNTNNMPDYLLITVTGKQSNKMMGHLTEDIVTVMDEHLGAYEEFAPIIFDVSQAKSQTFSVGDSGYDGEFSQRLSQFIIVTGEPSGGGLFGKLADAAIDLVPGIDRVQYLDEAIRKVME